MFLPLLFWLTPMPEAIFITASTGYAGVLAALASMKYISLLCWPSMESIRGKGRGDPAVWLDNVFQGFMISMFFLFAKLAYTKAHVSLVCMSPQVWCSRNLVARSRSVMWLERPSPWILYFDSWKTKGWLDRYCNHSSIAPIKDLKTLIYTFSRLKQEIR